MPTLHRLRLPVLLSTAGPTVRLAGDRIVALSPGTGSSSELVSTDLRGRVRRLARFTTTVEQVGGFDASERNVTWASRRITHTSVDCPPPGQGRPCRQLKSGVATVWVAGTSGPPRAVERWSFTDAN
jgi:hypothetical protein